ncbi:MAG: proton-conducting membrane transporter, partial [Acetatifactor sp.]|nr:proton-conducting membrane transporter [Acetatifactor sp.]
VNTGAFAVMRVTYYSFGASAVKGTWAQTVVMILVIITIIYGCSRALKETHIKRRLAWSTVSNLSYILFGAALMTPLGLLGAVTHMLFHSIMKICSFFCAGAVIYKTGRNYVHELDGFGRKMPRVFVIFTVSALALMGVPGLSGFVSKWQLAKAAVDSETLLGYVGVAALLVSALLTAIYMLTIVVRAFFPGKDFDYAAISDVEDPNWMMLVPLAVFVVVIFCFGLRSGPVLQLLESVLPLG